MLLATSYFAPIVQYALIVKCKTYQLEIKEHFIKQTFRNRCEVYGANGKLNLIVPLKKWKNHTKTEEIRISNTEDWQTNHWRSLRSAYQSSPYFEFYENELKDIFNKKFEFLVELNCFAEKRINNLLKIEPTISKTEKYIASEYENDYRALIHPKNGSFVSKFEFREYIQVFESKYGFIENLSILDLIFNLGPNSTSYLENIVEKNGKKD